MTRGKRWVIRAVLMTAAILPLAAALAQMVRGPSTIVVFGDAAQDALADLARFASLLDPRDRLRIVAGEAATEIPEHATLVWFGDLMPDLGETSGLPDPLKSAVDALAAEVPERPEGLANGETRMGVHCFAHHKDRADGLPEIAVTLSGDDPQDGCTDQTIASLLGKHGRWMRNDGTGCLLRDCALILRGSPQP